MASGNRIAVKSLKRHLQILLSRKNVSQLCDNRNLSMENAKKDSVFVQKFECLSHLQRLTRLKGSIC